MVTPFLADLGGVTTLGVVFLSSKFFKPSKQEIHNLKQLLLHPQATNNLLALEMLKSSGVPKELLTELLILTKQSVNATIKKEARRLLELNCTDAGKKVLQLPISLKSLVLKIQ